jgi:hypothetical protein
VSLRKFGTVAMEAAAGSGGGMVVDGKPELDRARALTSAGGAAGRGPVIVHGGERSVKGPGQRGRLLQGGGRV